MKLRNLLEGTESVVFTFGRFNPPTTGHEKLIEKVKKIAGGDDYYIFPSHSQNNKKDPLPLAKKVAYMRDMFPKHKRNIIANNKLKTVLDIAVYFHQQGYKELNMVVGSDRVAEFKKLLTTYNGQEKRHGFYDFDTIQIFSAGERDPDAEGVTGMSASKMRAAATNNDYDTFQKGLPRGFKNGNQLFKDVRKGMNLKENSKYSDEEIERDLYVRGAIYQIGDLVENINDGTSGEIIRRGTNYVQYTDGENVHKAFLHSIKEAKKITKTKQDPDIKDSPGSEPAKYYAKGVGDKKGMSVSTKKARDAHFTKGAKMDDDNPNAYKPAPGDKDKKTKPSQYTKKFKQMYGEVTERRIDPADVDTSATDDDIAAADKNIMMQLRKSVSLRGNFPVQFMDKKKVKVSSKIAQAVQSKYNSMKKPADKEKFQNRISKSYKDLLSALKEQLNINEQPKHEITVGDYTTKFFYMCGSAQTTMKKHADKEGAEELTRMQDLFYKMEKDAMDSGGASDEQKKKSQILYDKIIAKADDMGIKNEVDKYMKLHLTSMLNNKPKLGFGRTDLEEQSKGLYYNINKKKKEGRPMRKKGEKGAPSADDFKNAAKTAKTEDDIKEMPYYRKIYDKIHQMTHPKGYDKILKMYIQMHKQGHRNPASALGQMIKGIEARDIAYYINGLVKKGKLPSNLAAKVDFEIDESVNLTEKIAGLVKKSQQTGVPYGILKKSYDRGLAAWRTGHRPGTTPQQWAFARVNSMLTGGKADPDLQKQARASKKKKKKEAYEIGEPYARHTFDVTPGQDYEQSVKSKVASESNIQEWFERPSTRKEYQERYKDEWEEKLQETYNRMRSKISKDDLEDKYIEKLEIVESEYQGRKVKLNDPFRLPSGSKKKFGVYVKNEKGNVVKVTFGDPNMEIKRDDPGRLKSFRARHNCDNPGPKTKARYWSCFQWRKGAKVDN